MAKLENVKILDMVNGEPTRVEYNGAVYVKTEDDAEAGDLVRVIDEDGIGYVTQGGFYETYMDGVDLVFVDDDGDERDYDFYDTELETFRKVSETKVIADLAERLAELERRLEALEERMEEATEAESVPKFEVGDYVVPLPESDDKYAITNTNMKLGKVIHVYSDDDIKIEIIAHEDDTVIGEEYRVEPKYFRKATDEEVAQAKAKTQPKFEVGDYARVVESDSCHYANIGDIVKIVEDDKSGMPYRCEDLNGEDVGWFKEHELELVTDEEARWAKIGRKPGEFKKGDIVRVLKNNPHGSEKRKGDIDEITYYDNNESFCVGEGAGWMGYEDVELIVPVEQRFDLAVEPKVGARQ
jgi:ribosomal protein L19